MNKTCLLALALLAVLFGGCRKDDVRNSRINIIAESMHQGGSKVLHDPDNLDNATWIAGESININGALCSISEDGNHSGNYYLDGTESLSGDIYAIYPASVNDTLGNEIEVVNGQTGSCGIGLKKLAVTFIKDENGDFTGKHEVIFPMSALATNVSSDASDKILLFHHLTGGIKLTLSNTTAHTINRLVVSATRSSGAPAIYRDLSPMLWDCTILPLLPSFPEQHGQTDDQDVGEGFIADMTLMMNTRRADGKVTHSVTIPAGESITFCIPMLAKELNYIQITGYYNTQKIFQTIKKNIGTATNIQRNVMYTIPTIQISD